MKKTYREWVTEQKAWIDKATYYQLLKRWRYSPIGDPIFSDELGRYYAEVMATKRRAHPDPVSVSKRVGWGDQQLIEEVMMEAPTTPLPPPSPILEKALQLIKESF